MKRSKILARENRYGKNKENLHPNYENELKKDKWDVRNLGIPYNKTRGDYYLSFEKIPVNFRPLVKSMSLRELLKRIVSNGTHLVRMSIV